MKRTLTQKIIDEHLVEGSFQPGGPIAITIDQTLTQDATGTMAALEFEALGLDRTAAEVSVSYVDHNLLQGDFKNPDDHRFLRSFAARFGLWFSPPGNGICHQLHLLNFARPGGSLLGSDSHTPHCGGLAMLAMGAGGLDVAAAMAGRPFNLVCPRVLGVRLEGELPPWVGAKDVILELLGRLGVKGGLGYVVEYHGPGLETLAVHQRAAICNMGAELGATASLFPSDKNTRRFLLAQGRKDDYRELAADPGCQYHAREVIDLSALEPLAACPSSPDKVVPVRELGQVAVEQVIVGSCASSGYEDLMLVSRALEGRKLAPGLSLDINPGSRRALAQLSQAGGLLPLIEAGARLHQSGCLGCIGMSQAPATGTASVRTFPRNFPGRSGTAGDQVYLTGPETAVASALAGRIADPRELGAPPQIPPAPRLLPDALVPPPADGSGVAILRGPNIAPFPEFEPLAADPACTVALKVGDNITTDHIMPAGGKILPLRSNIPAISEYVFSALDPEFARRARASAPAAVVGGENYGQGSSREHAALAPRYLGVLVKLAKSFARIHKANLINFGIAPLVFADPADYDRLEVGARIHFPGLARAIADGAEEINAEVQGGGELKLLLQVSRRDRKLLLSGGLLNHIKGGLG